MGDLNKKDDSPIGTENNGKNYGSFNDDLAKILSTGQNPYPDHAGYTELREQYGDDSWYSYFFSKLYIKGNDIILFDKKLSILSDVVNNKNIIDGSYIDRKGFKGKEGIIYFTGEAASNLIQSHNFNYFKTYKDLEYFIDLMPGNSQSAKINSLVTLLGLEKSGYFNAANNQRSPVDIRGEIFVGIPEKRIEGSENTLGITYGVGGSEIKYLSHRDARPVLVFEEVA